MVRRRASPLLCAVENPFVGSVVRQILSPSLRPFRGPWLRDCDATYRRNYRPFAQTEAQNPAVRIGRMGDASRRKEGRVDRPEAGGARARRSEEHTSELQSLMRISYAVFCLKKKK